MYGLGSWHLADSRSWGIQHCSCFEVYADNILCPNSFFETKIRKHSGEIKKCHPSLLNKYLWVKLCWPLPAVCSLQHYTTALSISWSSLCPFNGNKCFCTLVLILVWCSLTPLSTYLKQKKRHLSYQRLETYFQLFDFISGSHSRLWALWCAVAPVRKANGLTSITQCCDELPASLHPTSKASNKAAPRLMWVLRAWTDSKFPCISLQFQAIVPHHGLNGEDWVD